MDLETRTGSIIHVAKILTMAYRIAHVIKVFKTTTSESRANTDTLSVCRL